MRRLSGAFTLGALAGLALQPATALPDPPPPATALPDPPPPATELWRIHAQPTIDDVSPACGGTVEHEEFTNLPSKKRRAILRCYLRQISKELNRQLPARSDYTTLLERTSVAGATITYQFRADVYLKEIEPRSMKAWKSSVAAEICGDHVMHEIVSRGGAYRYLWRDRNGKYIDALVVSECTVPPKE
jgi:hypothetical protein